MDSESSHNPSSSHEEETASKSVCAQSWLDGSVSENMEGAPPQPTAASETTTLQAPQDTAAAALLDMNAQATPGSNMGEIVASPANEMHENSHQNHNGQQQQIPATANAGLPAQQQAPQTPHQQAKLPAFPSAEQRGQLCLFHVVICPILMSLLLLNSTANFNCFVIAVCLLPIA